MRRDRFFSIFLVVAAAVLSLVQAQGAPEEIEVPKNPEWLEEVDLSNVPNVPVRPVGSGECKNAKCDGTDNDRCFETCGNLPTVEDIYGCPKDHQWALTFDDGPSNYTTELLDLLDEHNIKATFCVMGYHVEKYPEIVKRAYESGHQIASHTYSHPHLMSLSNEEIVYEIKATEEAIKDAIGIKPKYVRPPFGEADARVKAILKAMGYKVLLWNVDPTDYDVYMKPDASKRIQGAFRMAAAGKDTGLNAHEDPGFISLQHDLYKQSIAQVPHIIKYLKEKGYSFMTAAECLEDEEPHELLSEAVAVQNIKQMNESSINNFEAAAATGNSSKGSPASSSSAVINRVASHHAASSAMRAQAYNVLGFFTLLFVSALFF